MGAAALQGRRSAPLLTALAVLSAAAAVGSIPFAACFVDAGRVAGLWTRRAFLPSQKQLVRSAFWAQRAESLEECREASEANIADYAAIAERFAEGNLRHDVSQNIEAFLSALEGKDAPLKILDVGCASGRDLVTFSKLGHQAIGLDGVSAFCEMARNLSGCEVWEQDLLNLDLPKEEFDGIFCNACLFHIPSSALPVTLKELSDALVPGGVLFVSNAHGFGEDREGWVPGRTGSTRSYVCWLSEDTWNAYCDDAGFELLDSFYRPPDKPPEKQPFLATVWRKPD